MVKKKNIHGICSFLPHSVHLRSFHYVILKYHNAYLSKELEEIIHLEHNVCEHNDNYRSALAFQ